MKSDRPKQTASAPQSHAFIKVDEYGKVLESELLTIEEQEQAVTIDRKKELFDKAVKAFFAIEDKSDVIKNGLNLTVREKDYPLFVAMKDELSKATQCSVFIHRKVTSQKKSPQEPAARKRYLFDKAVKQFFSIEDKTATLKKGFSLSVRESDYSLMLEIKKELSRKIQCPVQIEKRQSSSKQTSAARKNYLFDKAVKSFLSIEDKSVFLKKGLCISAREGDYELMLMIKDELCKEIKCPVHITKRERAQDQQKTLKLDGQTKSPSVVTETPKLKPKSRRLQGVVIKADLQEIHYKRTFLEVVSGPFLSTFFHVVLIVGLAILLTDRYQEIVPEIKVTVVTPDELIVEEPPPIEEPLPEEIEDYESLNPELTNITIETATENDAPLEKELDEPPSVDDDAILPAVNDVVLSPSPLVSVTITAGRSGSGRAANVARFGGTVAGQESLMKALWWLAKVQNPDGSWGQGRGAKVAMTGLALLTFLAHGETDDSKNFGQVVEKGIDYLLLDPVDLNVSNGYPHAIKTYALAEALAMTGMEAISIRMNECVSSIIKGQQDGGSFDYRYKTDERRQDLSIAGWNFQALKAAYGAGSTNVDLPEAIYKSITWLKAMSYGKFSYETRNNNVVVGTAKHTMRAVGVLCLQLFGEVKFDGIIDDLEHISKKDILNYSWDKAPKNALYGWYYATQAMFQAGGEMWKAWNDKFQQVLVDNQHDDGYWEHPGEYSGPDDELTSRVFATTLAALQLTVYYRYLPSSKNGNTPIFTKRKVPPEEEGIDLVE